MGVVIMQDAMKNKVSRVIEMKQFVSLLSLLLVASNQFYAANYSVGGQIASLKAHGTDPAIRLSVNIVPAKCEGGTSGLMYFAGTVAD